jgi:hypothetical protein
MAVTVHYLVDVNGQLTLRSRLIAFKLLPKSHSGHNLGQTLRDVLGQTNGFYDVRFFCIVIFLLKHLIIQRLDKLPWTMSRPMTQVPPGLRRLCVSTLWSSMKKATGSGKLFNILHRQ